MIDDATLKDWTETARRDDACDRFVPSDIRQMLGEIERLRGAVRWACGEKADAQGVWFGDEMPETKIGGAPRPYWWRTKLRLLAGF